MAAEGATASEPPERTAPGATDGVGASINQAERPEDPPAAPVVVDPVMPARSESSPPTDPPRTAPALPGRDPMWARLLIVFGTVLVLAASGAITATKVLAHRYERSVHKDTLLAPGSRTTDGPSSTITGPLNYLLIGSDARADNPEDGQRSDTMIIVHIPASLDRAYLISIPRDLLVDIPPSPPTNFGGSHET